MARTKEFLLYRRRADGDGWEPVDNGLREQGMAMFSSESVRYYQWIHDATDARALVEGLRDQPHGAVYKVFALADGATFEVERPFTPEPPPIVREVDA